VRAGEPVRQLHQGKRQLPGVSARNSALCRVSAGQSMTTLLACAWLLLAVPVGLISWGAAIADRDLLDY
tara:strand:+ start:9501 stop:9707 length:207 start_codon:yes stop_codon:yes gene_type:complete